MALDISQNELYIKSFEGIHKNYLEKRSIPFCRPRRSDGFVYILGGSCLYEFSDKRSFTASEGDLLYLSEGAVYKMDVLSRYDFICVNFYFESDDVRASDVYAPLDSAKSENLFYKLWRGGSSSTLAEKMSMIYRIYTEILLSRRTAYLQGGAREKIAEAISLISGDPQATHSVTSLAKSAEMSEVYFRKLFKAVTGTSPARFMINCRVDRAKELLQEDYLSLDEISERCGFSSLSYFCRIFKESTGMTPGEFRAGIPE